MCVRAGTGSSLGISLLFMLHWLELNHMDPLVTARVSGKWSPPVCPGNGTSVMSTQQYLCHTLKLSLLQSFSPCRESNRFETLIMDEYSYHTNNIGFISERYLECSLQRVSFQQGHSKKYLVGSKSLLYSFQLEFPSWAQPLMEI